MKQRYLLLSLFIFITSCSRQAKVKLPKDGVDEQKTEQSKITKSEGTDEYDNIHCSVQDKAGNLWFGSTGEGVYRYNPSTNGFIHFTEENGLSNNVVWSVIQDKKGNIWFGTDDGACYYDGKTFTSLPVPKIGDPPITEKNTANAVWSLLEDQTGTLWFGTTRGVYNYDPTKDKFTYFFNNDRLEEKNGVQLKFVQSIIEDKAGNIWFASWNREGVCRYDGKSITSFTPNKDDMVHSILEDKNGNIWFGTREHGACCYDPITGLFSNITLKEGLSHSSIYSMIEDKQGNIWFATESEGVWRFDGKSFSNFTTKEGLINNSVFSIVEDKIGNLWFGTRNVGLCNYDGKSFTNFSE